MVRRGVKDRPRQISLLTILLRAALAFRLALSETAALTGARTKAAIKMTRWISRWRSIPGGCSRRDDTRKLPRGAVSGDEQFRREQPFVKPGTSRVRARASHPGERFSRNLEAISHGYLLSSPVYSCSSPARGGGINMWRSDARSSALSPSRAAMTASRHRFSVVYLPLRSLNSEISRRLDRS